MAAFPVRQYKPGGEFVVVRDMDFGERRFKAGDVFPWREMGVHEATVQMLWKAVRLDVKHDTPPRQAATPSPSPAKRPPSADDLSDAELERLTAPRTAPTSAAKPPGKPQQSARR